MNDIVLILVSIISLFLVGITVGFLLYDDDKICELISFSYPLGVGVVALQMFIYSLWSIEWSFISIISPWIILLIIIIKSKQIKFNVKLPYIDKLYTKIILVLIFVLLSIVAIQAISRPVSGWDGWAIWLMKSKIFYIDQKINPSIFLYVESDYPFVMSLLGTFVYETLGKIDDRLVLSAFYAFYISLGIYFYFILKKKTSTSWAFLFTFLLLSLQGMVRQGGRFEVGYADLALSFYFFLISNYFINTFIKNSSLKSALFLQLLLSICALVKYEGLLFSLILEVIFIGILLYKKNYILLPSSLFYISFVGGWEVYKYIFLVPSGAFYLTPITISRSFLVVYNFLIEIIKINRWGMLWIAFSLILIVKNKTNDLKILTLLILLQLSGYFMIYLKTPINVETHILGSFNRLLLHVSPMACYVCAAYFYKYLCCYAQVKKSPKILKLIIKNII